MKKRIQNILIRLLMMLTVPLLAGAFIFASKEDRKNTCGSILIEFINPQLSFVNQQDIQKVIGAEGIISEKTPLHQLNLKQLEKHMEENKWIQSAEIFLTANRQLRIRLVQKTPVVRLQQADSSDYAYYLDPQGNTIEWSEQYSPRLPVASVPALGYGHEDYKLKTSLVQLAQFIQTDGFWNAAIAQIVVNDQYEIQLIPIMGKQLIRLGDTRDLQDKMNRLLRFYQEGVHKFPWDKYDELDLRFSKQIVCRNNRGEILAEDPYDDKSKMIVRKLDASSKQQTLVSNASKSKKINNEVKKETPSKKNPAANPTSKKNNAQKTTQIKPNSLKQ